MHVRYALKIGHPPDKNTSIITSSARTLNNSSEEFANCLIQISLARSFNCCISSTYRQHLHLARAMKNFKTSREYRTRVAVKPNQITASKNRSFSPVARTNTSQLRHPRVLLLCTATARHTNRVYTARYEPERSARAMLGEISRARPSLASAFIFRLGSVRRISINK